MSATSAAIESIRRAREAMDYRPRWCRGHHLLVVMYGSSAPTEFGTKGFDMGTIGNVAARGISERSLFDESDALAMLGDEKASD